MADEELLALEQQIAALSAKRNEMLKQKQDLEFAHAEAILEDEKRFPPRVKLYKWATHYEYGPHKISFELDRYSEPIVAKLRSIPHRTFQFNRNYIPRAHYNMLLELLGDEVDYEYEAEVLEQINNWKPTPDFLFDLIVDMDGNPQQGVCTLKNPSNEWLLKDKLRTGSYHHQLRQVRFDLFECEAALKLIEERKVTHGFVLVVKDRFAEYISKQAAPIDMDTPLPVPERFKLRPFQDIGVRTIAANNYNFLCLDEMGLGKSPQSIVAAELFMQQRNNPKTSIVVVCPAALKGNWARQIYKWTGKTCFILWGQRPTADQIASLMSKEYNYYIINYDLLITEVDDTFLWIDAINIAAPDMIIVDEIHFIKNVDSKRSRALLRLEAPHKIGLTGTPLVNRPNELWAPLKFVSPDIASSYEGFTKFYMAGRMPKNLQHLRSLLKKVSIRRTKKEVMPDLPPINRIVREYDLSNKGNQIYNLALQSLWKALDEWDDDGDSESITNILTQLLRLKQICAKDKVDYIADLAIELYENNTTDYRKVIIFTQFSDSPPIVTDIARRLDKDCLHFDGTLPPHERLKLVDKFQSDPNIKYLICSITSAKEGLDITAAGSVIFADFTWTPKDHTQAEARAYGRMNDPHSVDAYYVVTSDSIEEEIIKLIIKKMNLANVVLDGESSVDTMGNIAMDLIRVLVAQRKGKKLRESHSSDEHGQLLIESGEE